MSERKQTVREPALARRHQRRTAGLVAQYIHEVSGRHAAKVRGPALADATARVR